MSIVRPFKGLRVKPELAKQVASPPYDVLDTKEARAIADDNPYSFLRVNKSELEFDDSVNPYSDEVYKRARENLQKFEREGALAQDPRPCFYLYRLTMSGRSQTGLVALTSVEEYDQGKIKKHEHTRPEKVDDRARHISIVGAQVGPVFSTFRKNDAIEGIFRRVTYTPTPTDFVADDGIRHELWVIDDDETIKEIEDTFAKLPCLYIADGHHRSESAAELGRRMRAANPGHTGQEPYNFFINVIFSERELTIMPYNRVVRDLNGLTCDQFLDKAREKFTVTPQKGEVNPQKLHTFGFYCDRKWYLLGAKPGAFDPDHVTKSIDASVLADNLIAPVLGITNPRTDKRIDFVGGIRGTRELVRLVDSGECKAAFSLYPTSIEQLLNVADRGEVMPPKSTWFEPKLRDGLVIYTL
ncbi:MAG: hypothetical protein A2W25_01240 [candidate division Zixibacteria bacterium RBG_16_53_22]|nr:MAG: hypothetical protein A2W25_01240 [candidate division Zixibacteria bacterium RBG_16_53_22]